MNKEYYSLRKKIAKKLMMEHPCDDLKRMAEMCWHEPDKGYSDDIAIFNQCKLCGESRIVDSNWETCPPNPTPTVPTIVIDLKMLGLWEEFKLWGGIPLELYDTLTSDALMLKAVIMFLKMFLEEKP